MIDKISPGRRALTYVMLIICGASMVVPFLWMISTSLKTKEQTTRPNWIPTKQYVEYEGGVVEIDRIREDLEKPGKYEVQVRSGPRKGARITVSTADLRPDPVSKKLFSYKAPGARDVVEVKFLRLIQPKYYTVEIEHRQRPGAVIELSVPEDRIVNKISFEWKNFPDAARSAGNFGRSYLNSIAIAIIVTIGQVFTSSLAAYAFARLDFRGRDVLFLGYLTTMMIPAAVTMIPLFIVLKAMPDLLNYLFGTQFFSTSLYLQFGSSAARLYAGKPIGLDSYFALIAPMLFSAYGTFMLRQFFMGLPVDLEDAAKIDGCGLFRVYTNVILPLSKPALATLTIFTFMTTWRAFLWPMVVTSTPQMQTLPVMLQAFKGTMSTDYHLLMAGTLMVIAPLIALFFAGQRYFIEGIQLGAVKG